MPSVQTLTFRFSFVIPKQCLCSLIHHLRQGWVRFLGEGSRNQNVV